MAESSPATAPVVPAQRRPAGCLLALAAGALVLTGLALFAGAAGYVLIFERGGLAEAWRGGGAAADEAREGSEFPAAAWQEAETPDGGFAAWLPGPAARSRLPWPALPAASVSQQPGLEVLTEGARFNIGYLTYQPAVGPEPPTVSSLLALARDGLTRAIDGTIVRETDCWLDGIYPGREVLVRDSAGATVVQRAFLAQSHTSLRLYVLEATGVGQADRARFFGSFRFLADLFPPELPPGEAAPRRDTAPPLPRSAQALPVTGLARGRIPPEPYLQPFGGDQLPLRWPEQFKPVGQLPAFLTSAAAPDAGALVTTTRGGALHHYSYPNFVHQGTYWLEQAAYHAVLDGKRRRLYAATADPQTLAGRRAEHPFKGTLPYLNGQVLGTGDVRVYDVGTVLAGQGKPGTSLKPAATLKLGRRLACLLPSADGHWLYFLDVTDEAHPKVGRLDAERHALVGEATLPAYTIALCVAPGGRRLYAATAPEPYTTQHDAKQRGIIHVLDATPLAVLRSFDVPIAPCAIAPVGADQLALTSGSGQHSGALVVGVEKQAVAAKLLHSFRGDYLQATPAGDRLFLASRNSSPSRLGVYRAGGGPVAWREAGDVHGVAGQYVGSPITVTPDGRFLLVQSGAVFQLN